MVEFVTLNDLGNFLNNLIRGFDDILFMVFVMMIVFNIGIYLKYLITGVR